MTVSKHGMEHRRDNDRLWAVPDDFSLNKVVLLVDGPQAYEVMLSVIRNARRHVHLEMYIFRSVEEGQAGHRFAQALQEKAAEGVEVCLLYDPAGSRLAPRSFFEGLAKHGVLVVEHNPLNPLRAGHRWHPNRRDHRKLLIVDGRTAITGGIDISRHYDPETYHLVEQHELDPRKGAWHDIDVLIEGPAVSSLQQVFLDAWHQQAGPPLTGNYFPRLDECGDAPAVVVTAHPGDAQNAIFQAYLYAIHHARDYVHICNAYFIPGGQMAGALCQAAKRGVDVSLVVSGCTDFKTTIYARRYYYTSLLKSGIKLYERQDQVLHAKTAVVDRLWATVGSFNIDMRSRHHAEEANIVVMHEGFAAQLEQAFQDDLAQSNQVLLEDWQKRPWTQWLVEWVASRFRYWL